MNSLTSLVSPEDLRILLEKLRSGLASLSRDGESRDEESRDGVPDVPGLAELFALGDLSGYDRELELQQLRFQFMRDLIRHLDLPGLAPGLSGFDLALERDGSREMFVLVDQIADLDPELADYLRSRIRTHLFRHPGDRCFVGELFGSREREEDWSGGESDLQGRILLLSRDRLFCRIAGRDLSPDLELLLSADEA